MGLLDGMFKLFCEMSQCIRRDFSKIFALPGTWDAISNKFNQLDSNSEISPEGMVALLQFTGDVITDASLADSVVEVDLLKKIIGVLKIDFLECLANWPSTRGGGTQASNALVRRICEILTIGFESSSSSVSMKFTEALFHGVCETEYTRVHVTLNKTDHESETTTGVC